MHIHGCHHSRRTSRDDGQQFLTQQQSTHSPRKSRLNTWSRHNETSPGKWYFNASRLPHKQRDNMSVLPAEVHAALVQLLQGLQSTDNPVRASSEEQLNTEWVNKQPGMLLMGLAEQMQGSQDDGVSEWISYERR